MRDRQESTRESSQSRCISGLLTRVLTVGVVLCGLSLPALAAKTFKYRGIHPLPPHAGEFCYIDFFHVHAHAPSDMRGYRVLPNQEHLFVGDEVALGYQGSKYAYFGPHALTVADAPKGQALYCYLRGPHFHASAPAPGSGFLEKDGVAWYTGAFGPEFDRDRFNVWVNDVRPIASYRPPQVDISAAPPGYQLPATVAAPVIHPPAPAAPGPAQKGNGKGASAARASRGAGGSP
ncbi:MAG: hypothetical protein ABIW57_00570 [Polyangia bacterium]